MFNYHSTASAGIRVIVTETKSSCNLSLFSFFFAYVIWGSANIFLLNWLWSWLCLYPSIWSLPLIFSRALYDSIYPGRVLAYNYCLNTVGSSTLLSCSNGPILKSEYYPSSVSILNKMARFSCHNYILVFFLALKSFIIISRCSNFTLYNLFASL